MTPADILAAARLSPLSPVVPARREWLDGWVGPVLLATDNVPYAVATSFLRFDGVYTFVCASSTNPSVTLCAIAEHIRLDLRRREVRDHLVRMGAPEWCRESVAGMLSWARGGRPIARLGAWRTNGSRALMDGDAANGLEYIGDAGSWCPETPTQYGGGWRGWALYVVGAQRSGIETGPEGRACADLAALSAGCVLTEADGWCIPLPNGQIGWLPKEKA